MTDGQSIDFRSSSWWTVLAFFFERSIRNEIKKRITAWITYNAWMLHVYDKLHKSSNYIIILFFKLMNETGWLQHIFQSYHSKFLIDANEINWTISKMKKIQYFVFRVRQACMQCRNGLWIMWLKSRWSLFNEKWWNPEDWWRACWVGLQMEFLLNCDRFCKSESCPFIDNLVQHALLNSSYHFFDIFVHSSG